LFAFTTQAIQEHWFSAIANPASPYVFSHLGGPTHNVVNYNPDKNSCAATQASPDLEIEFLLKAETHISAVILFGTGASFGYGDSGDP